MFFRCELCATRVNNCLYKMSAGVCNKTSLTRVTFLKCVHTLSEKFANVLDCYSRFIYVSKKEMPLPMPLLQK